MAQQLPVCHFGALVRAYPWHLLLLPISVVQVVSLVPLERKLEWAALLTQLVPFGLPIWVAVRTWRIVCLEGLGPINHVPFHVCNPVL